MYDTFANMLLKFHDRLNKWHIANPIRYTSIPRQTIIIPKPELRGFRGKSLTKRPFGVTSAEVAIICPGIPSILTKTVRYLKWRY